MANNILTDFKVILNSNDATTWTGTKFNATYNLDLKQILRDDSYLDKQYQLTYNFQSTRDTTIQGTSVYLLNLQFNNGATNTAIHQPFGSGALTTGILPFKTDVSTNFFSAGEQDNATTFVANLRNLNSVRVQITDQTFATFGTATVSYICVLHFTEVQGANPYNSAPYSTRTLTNPDYHRSTNGSRL